MKTAISKDNEDSPWTESNAGLRATKHHIPGRLATNIEFVDSSSSLFSDEEDMNEWTTQCTGKREAPRKQAAQEKATKKQPNKGSAHNFNNNFKKSATHSKIKRKDSNQQRRKTDSNNAIENERNQLKVTIVGDSQVNRLDEMKLCNDSRKVEKRAKGGMKIKEVVNKVGVCNSDVIIVHAGTCDINAKTPEELRDEIIAALQAIKARNRRSQIAFSSILRRKDSELLSCKVKKVNELLKEELELHGFDLIDNDNVLFSNIGADGLHINPGGTRKFAGNLASYLRYC